MIDKETATAHGVTMLDNNTILQDDTAQRIEALKRILPTCINSDNQLNTQALQDILNIADTTSNNKGYELTFAGKGIARAMANTETTKELKTEHTQSKHFDTTGNIVLRGDNIDALKILYQNYYGKIKMIYIDPPYNTQSENFIYNDNFKQSEEALIEEFGLGEETTNFLHNVYGTKSHSGWLAFMYPRLTLARELLTDDGVIFISIDDNEQANLKIMCDEVFGEDNFAGGFIWKKKQGGGNDSNVIVVEHEHIIAYSRSIPISLNLDSNYKLDDNLYPFKDEVGEYGLVTLDKSSLGYIESLDFEIKDRQGNSYFPRNKLGEKKFRWRWSKDKVEKEFDKLVFKDGKVYTKYYRPSGVTPRSLLTDSIYGRTETGNDDIKDIFGNAKPFNYPKPCSLIKHFINLGSNPNDIILDFFAGSGTTGDAVMQLNAEDGGNRKFILVQLDETIDKKKHTEAHTFCTEHNMPPVISSICIERLNRAGKKIHKAWQEQRGLDASHGTLDIGYKVFSLTDKPRIIQDEQQVFKITNERSITIDTLYNMLTATCKTLDTPIETIIKDTLYQCDHELYLIATVEQEILEPYKDQKINIDAYANINLETFLNLGVATSDNVTVVF